MARLIRDRSNLELWNTHASPERWLDAFFAPFYGGFPDEFAGDNLMVDLYGTEDELVVKASLLLQITRTGMARKSKGNAAVCTCLIRRTIGSRSPCIRLGKGSMPTHERVNQPASSAWARVGRGVSAAGHRYWSVRTNSRCDSARQNATAIRQ